MKKSKVIFLALLACAFGASAETVVVGQLNGKDYYSLDTMINDAQDVDAEIVMFTNASLSVCMNVTNTCVIRGRGAPYVISPSSTAGFRISTGGSLTISNLVFTGFVDDDPSDDYGFIGIDGGALTLDDGAVLDGIVGNVYRGSGVVDLNEGTATVKSGAAIINCRAEGAEGEGLGGAIYVLGAGCTLNLQGGAISNCYASSVGGGVYACGWNGDADINLSGNLTIADNRSGNYAADNLYMRVASALPGLKLVGDIEGRIGIRYYDSKCNAEGGAFMTNAVGAVSSLTLRFLSNDADATLMGAIGEDGMLVWAKKPVDGQCAYEKAVAFVREYDESWTWVDYRFYDSMENAFAYLTPGTVNMIEMSGCCTGAKEERFVGDVVVPSGCQVTLMADSSYKIRRRKSSRVDVPKGTSLTLMNILFMQDNTYATVTNALFGVSGGALTLANGACISNIIGNASRDAAAITVYNGGVVAMESGSRIYGCQNTNNYGMVFEDSSNYGCGGGILVDNGTAYLRGGEIAGCLATRGGGVYVCNQSAAYVSGDMRIADNEWLDTNGVHRVGNVFVADQATMYLGGALIGEIHTRGLPWTMKDTNLVAEVSYVWTNAIDVLASSASNFVHDVSRDTGVAVTNGTTALIVWSACLKTDPNTGRQYYMDVNGKRYGFADGVQPDYGAAVVMPCQASFKSVAYSQEDGMVSFVVTDAVQWCNYKIFGTNSLVGGFVLTNAAGAYVIQPETNFQWTSTAKEMELALPVDGENRFWKIVVESGVKKE